MILRIKNWNESYENNRTRDMKIMRWVPIPNEFDGDGYTMMMDDKNGAAIYGAWIACVTLASKCEPRGTLVRSNGVPHDVESISRITRIEKLIVQKMIDFCLNNCKWLENMSPQEGAEKPQEGAEKPQEGARKEGKEGKEGNGRERKEKTAFSDTVFMFDDEYETLILQYGVDFVQSCIDKLNSYKCSSGKKYKSDYHAIKTWVIDDRMKANTISCKNTTLSRMEKLRDLELS